MTVVCWSGPFCLSKWFGKWHTVYFKEWPGGQEIRTIDEFGEVWYIDDIVIGEAGLRV